MKKYISILKPVLLVAIASFLIGIIAGSATMMIGKNSTFPIVSPLTEFITANTSKKEVIGFLPYWLVQKAEDSYAKKITTLAYFSLTISPDGTIQKLVNDTEEEPGWTTLKKDTLREYFTRAKQEGLKTSLVIFNGNEQHIDQLLSNPVLHARNLITDITPIMQNYHFDDLNIDIESLIEASASSQQQFTDFLRTVKEGMRTNKLGTLTVDTTVTTLFEQQRIHPVEVSKIADTVVLMTYDYHYAGSHLSGPVAPLGGAGINRFNDVETSIRVALQYIPPEKLLLGIPFYGYEWETLDNYPGAPIIPGTGKTASDKRAEGLKQSCSTCTFSRDPVSDEPYIIFPEGPVYHQIFYTDETTIAHTLDLTKKLQIKGAALWALGYEDTETMNPFLPYLLK